MTRRWVAGGVAVAVVGVLAAGFVLLRGDDGTRGPERSAAPAATRNTAADGAAAAAADDANALAAVRQRIRDAQAQVDAVRRGPFDPEGSTDPWIEPPDPKNPCGRYSLEPAGTKPTDGQVALSYPMVPTQTVLMLEAGPHDLDTCGPVAFWRNEGNDSQSPKQVDNFVVTVGPHTVVACGPRPPFGPVPAVKDLDDALRASVPDTVPVLREAVENYDRCDLKSPKSTSRVVTVDTTLHLLAAPVNGLTFCYRCDLSGLTLADLDLPVPGQGANKRFPARVLVGSDLRGLTIHRSKIESLAVYGARADGMRVVDSSLKNSTFDYTTFGTDASRAPAFVDVDLTGATFAFTDLSSVVFGGVTFGDLADPDVNTTLFCSPMRGQVALSRSSLGLPPDKVVVAGALESAFPYLNVVPLNQLPADICDRTYEGGVVDATGLRVGSYVDLTKTSILVEGADALALTGADLSNALLDGADFVGLTPDLAGVNLSGAHLKDVDLAGANFLKPGGTAADRADLSDIEAEHIDLRGANLRRADLSGAHLRRALLTGADLANADLNGVDAATGSTDAATFDGIYAHDANLGSIKADGASFAGAHLYGDAASLVGARLAGAKFPDAVLDGTDLSNAFASGADFSRASCVGCTFGETNLSGANFTPTVLYGADFAAKVDMTNTKLTGSWLTSSDIWDSPVSDLEASFSLDATPARLPTDKSLQNAVCPDGSPASATGCNDVQRVVKTKPSRACRAAGSYVCPWQVATLPLPDGDDPVAVTRNPASAEIAVVRADPSQAGATLVLTDGTDPATSVTLRGVKRPTAIAPAPEGRYYVADAEAHRIWLVNATTGMASAFAGTGTAGDSGDGGPANAATFQTPSGLWVDPTGRVFVSDAGAHRVRVIDPDGIIGPFAGNGSAGSATDGAPAAKAAIGSPSAVTGDPSGVVYIADGVAAVYRVDQTGTITRVVGTGTAGAPSPEITGATPATGVPIDGPAGVAVVNVQTAAPSVGGPATTLLVVDGNNARLRPVSSVGAMEASWIGGGTGDPADGGDAADAALGAPTAIYAESDRSAIYVVDAGGDGPAQVIVLRPA